MTPPQVGGDGHADVAQAPPQITGTIPNIQDITPPWPGPGGVSAILRESLSYLLPLANSPVLISGQATLSAFPLVAGDRVSAIRFCSATTAANGPTHQTFGFYDLVGNRYCTTADDLATAWAANTMKSLAVTAVNKVPGGSDVTAGPWIVPQTGTYLVACTVTATVAVPTLVGLARLAGSFGTNAFNFDSYIPAAAGLAGVLPNSIAPIGTPGSAASTTMWAAVS